MFIGGIVVNSEDDLCVVSGDKERGSVDLWIC